MVLWCVSVRYNFKDRPHKISNPSEIWNKTHKARASSIIILYVIDYRLTISGKSMWFVTPNAIKSTSVNTAG
jgi:hypothetical protein